MNGGNLHFYALCFVLYISISTYHPEILISSKRKEEKRKDVALTGCKNCFIEYKYNRFYP